MPTLASKISAAKYPAPSRSRLVELSMRAAEDELKFPPLPQAGNVERWVERKGGKGWRRIIIIGGVDMGTAKQAAAKLEVGLSKIYASIRSGRYGELSVKWKDVL